MNNSIQIFGGCHCQAVRFRIETSAPLQLLRCNCSICSMTGFLHLIVPHTSFELLTPMDQLSSYRFNTGQANHLFCKHCGIKSYYQPRSHPDAWSVNAHCLQDVNPADWIIRDFDGANWEQAHAQL